MNGNADTNLKRWIRRKAVWGACVAAGVLLSALLLASCGSQVREGEAPSYLIVDSIVAASGAEPDEFGTVLHSDVITMVKKTDPVTGDNVFVPTIYSDAGKVTLRLALKDPGPQSVPTTNNFITITRYRVSFGRTDGRNTPGIDVPYPFDGTVTITVGREAIEAGFLLVRHQMKLEAPLLAIANAGGAGFITTNAEVTFYGHDQTGRAVVVTTHMTVIFGNFGDPE